MMEPALDAPAYDDLWAAGWDDTRLYGPMARHSRRIVKVLCADLSPCSILDVGCGEGSMLKTLMSIHTGAKCTGVEISEKAIHLAKHALPRASFRYCDITIESLDETFDLVVSADVVEHIEEDTKAIKNMVAMTQPGGRIIISTLQGRMRKFEKQVGHVRNYAPGELEEKLKAAGVSIEQVITWGWPFYSPLYRNLLDILGNRGTIGNFGPIRKLICHLLYVLFLFNRSTKGDYLFVRAVKDKVQ
ncbi:MAG: class I SAM-dependent methyltransferase [Rhodospirillaceae bacterium]